MRRATLTVPVLTVAVVTGVPLLGAQPPATVSDSAVRAIITERVDATLAKGMVVRSRSTAYCP